MTATQMPAINRWRTLTGAVIALLMGGALYSFTVFALPFAKLRGWEMPDVMFAFGLTSMLAPMVMIASGTLIDRGYTRALMIAGGLLYGTGHILAGIVETLPLFYLSYGIIVGVGQGIMYSAALSNTMKFFPDKRGLAAGLITGGMGAGSAIFAPLGRSLISSYGVSTAFVVLGLIFAVVVISCGMFLTQAAPPGYMPPGWQPPARAGGGPGAFKQIGWKGMLASAQFWLILPMFVTGAFFGLMITSNLSPISQNMFGVTPQTAALYVSLLAVFNAAGRIAWGWISDRIGVMRALSTVFLVAGACLILMGTGSGITVLTIGVVVLGFTFGGIMSLFPPLTMANYGPKNQGVNYGIVFSAFALSGLVAPRWASSIGASAGGDFSQAFFIGAAIAGVGLVLSLIFPLVDKARPLQN